MTVAHTKWQNNNDGVYVKLDVGHTETFVIDVKAQLNTGDFLKDCIATTSSTNILLGYTVHRAEGETYPHQQLVTLEPTAVGVHNIKLTSRTQDGYTIVKHFDVLTER